MESAMRKTILTGVAALALVSLPTFAQEADADVTVTLNADQQAIYDAWTADERAAFDLWPPAHRTYFWTLPPERQRAYRYLTEDQRMQIDAMNLTQRDAAWKSIDAQIAAGANNSATSVAARTGGTVPAPAQSANAANASAAVPPSSTTVVTDANPRTPTVVARNMPGNLAPPPASAMNKTYPVCRGKVQDSCQNPGEGGAPGRSRALSYWPGEPASETDVGG
jgi:hypothetical protein